MIIARAAKGAALLLMIFGVVALIGCPAAAKGATGDKGAKGDTGARGEPGATGQPGPAALGAVGDSDDPHVIYINDAGTTAVPLIGDVNDPKGGVDVTALFAGGTPPIKYAISVPPLAAHTFRATINDDNEIVVTKRAATVTSPTGDYDAGTVLTVRATDAGGVTATKSVEIRTNKAPTTVPAGNTEISNIIVGTQSEKYSDTYEPQNVASIDFYQRASGSAITGIAQWLFADGGSADDAAAQAAREALTYKLMKVSRGTGTGAEYATVELTGSVLTVTGLKSTWDDDASPAAHVPIQIEVEATDPGGLSVKRTFRATVDGVPGVKDTGPPAVISKKATGTQGVVVRGLASFFEDPEDATITIVGATLAPTQLGTVDVDSGNLRLTPNNQGQATITFYVQSGGEPSSATGYYSGAYIDRDADGEADGASATTLTQVLKHEIKVTITP